MKKKNINEQKIIKLYLAGESQSMIAKKLGVSQWLISQKLKNNKIKTRPKYYKLNRRKYTVNEDFFNKIDNNVAWVLGWILADGSLSDRKLSWHLAKKDEDVLVKISQILNYTGPLYQSTNKLKGKIHYMITLAISSDTIIKRLNKLGIKRRKSLNEKYLTCIKKINSETIHKNFIRGIFEGDGSILNTSTKSTVFQIVGTNSLLKDIQLIMNKYINIGFTKLSNNIKGKNHYALRYRGIKKPKLIFDWLYKDAELFLNRKYNKYMELI